MAVLSDLTPGTGPGSEGDRVRTRRLVFCLAAIALVRLLALRFAGLGLFFDEAQYWSWSRQLDFGYFSKPGMIAWIIAATTQLFGDAPFGVRVGAPLVHLATAAAVYLLGRRLYDARVGFWAALGYALMPAVALSSLLISTDVPLLFFWTLGLLAGERLSEKPGAGPALGFGLAVALGLNAKYAMIYLPVLLLAYLAATPSRRAALKSPWLWAALAIGLAGLLPNLLWNMRHAFVTVTHTGGNVGFGHVGFHPGRMLEFLASQLAIAGPILPVAAVIAAFRPQADKPRPADRYLLITSLPIIAGVALDGLVFGKMNANWAATAFPALVLVATSWLVAGGHRRWLAASLAVGLVASLVIGPGSVAFHFVEPPRVLAQVRKMMRWDDFAAAVAATAEKSGLATVVLDGRMMVAEGIYGLRDSGFAVKALKRDRAAAPADHFEMTCPWSPGDPAPVLLVTAVHGDQLGLEGYRATLLAELRTGVRLGADGVLYAYRLDAVSAPSDQTAP